MLRLSVCTVYSINQYLNQDSQICFERTQTPSCCENLDSSDRTQLQKRLSFSVKVELGSELCSILL